MQAFETTARIDDIGQLHLDQPLLIRNRRARVVVLVDERLETAEWLQAMTINPSFAFLRDSEEDVYTVEDGVPVFR